VADYLLPISDREPLAWIVTQQRTAVGAHRRREAERLVRGDRLFLYTTRACFHNPNRDQGRVIGIARIARPARRLQQPVKFGERAYIIAVDLKIESLTPHRTGIELLSLLHRLESFPDRQAWRFYLRRTLVPLTLRDANTLAEALDKVAGTYEENAATYVRPISHPSLEVRR
jgi:hypothetical protein